LAKPIDAVRVPLGGFVYDALREIVAGIDEYGPLLVQFGEHKLGGRITAGLRDVDQTAISLDNPQIPTAQRRQVQYRTRCRFVPAQTVRGQCLVQARPAASLAARA